MNIKKHDISDIKIIKNESGKIINIITKVGNRNEDNKILYDCNGNILRIGAEWVNWGTENNQNHINVQERLHNSDDPNYNYMATIKIMMNKEGYYSELKCYYNGYICFANRYKMGDQFVVERDTFRIYVVGKNNNYRIIETFYTPNGEINENLKQVKMQCSEGIDDSYTTDDGEYITVFVQEYPYIYCNGHIYLNNISDVEILGDSGLYVCLYWKKEEWEDSAEMEYKSFDDYVKYVGEDNFITPLNFIQNLSQK